MNILYMNQGGGGQWGAIDYSEYDIILLAESNVEKVGFEINWESKTEPVMSVQLRENSRLRIITGITDLDVTVQQVRPLVTFTLVKENIRVVFVHLKSGNEKLATDALNAAINKVRENKEFTSKQPILWIGDFNRANDGCLEKTLNAELVFGGGGQSQWDLDRAYISGQWDNYTYKLSVPTRAGADHDHVAIGFRFTPKE